MDLLKTFALSMCKSTLQQENIDRESVYVWMSILWICENKIRS